MNATHEKQGTELEKLFKGVLLLDVKVLGLTSGLMSGLVIFIATNWLVLKGGRPVGPNLQLLAQYFIGYRVTFVGSLIGFGYGFVSGGICGALVGWIYNRITSWRNGL